MNRKLPRLHIITDTTIQQRYSHFSLAEAAFRAGEIAVQYRNKHFVPAKDQAELQQIADMATERKRMLIVNDAPLLAKQVGAMGAHVGQEDGSPLQAKLILGLQGVVGATVHDFGELAALNGAPIDYIGVGPVYGTQSKNLGLPEMGLRRLSEIAARSPWPVIAIGGIQRTHIPEVMATGVYGIAVISAYCMADDLYGQAQSLLEAVEGTV